MRFFDFVDRNGEHGCYSYFPYHQRKFTKYADTSTNKATLITLEVNEFFHFEVGRGGPIPLTCSAIVLFAVCIGSLASISLLRRATDRNVIFDVTGSDVRLSDFFHVLQKWLRI